MHDDVGEVSKIGSTQYCNKSIIINLNFSRVKHMIQILLLWCQYLLVDLKENIRIEVQGREPYTMTQALGLAKKFEERYLNQWKAVVW